MIPGRIRVPTLTLDAKWDEDPPRHLAQNVGQLKNTSSVRMIELRRNSYERWRNWMQFFRALMAADLTFTLPQVGPHH